MSGTPSGLLPFLLALQSAREALLRALVADPAPAPAVRQELETCQRLLGAALTHFAARGSLDAEAKGPAEYAEHLQRLAARLDEEVTACLRRAGGGEDGAWGEVVVAARRLVDAVYGTLAADPATGAPAEGAAPGADAEVTGARALPPSPVAASPTPAAAPPGAPPPAAPPGPAPPARAPAPHPVRARPPLARPTLWGGVDLSGLRERLRGLLTIGARKPGARVVSTGFAPASGEGAPLPPARPLVAGERYRFWLTVGPPVEGSIEVAPVGLPTHLLPERPLLTVALFGFPGGIEPTPGEDVGVIQLDEAGDALVVRQPGETTDRARPAAGRLLFPVTLPARPGAHRLRCSIYWRGLLVQSRVVRVRAAGATRPLAALLGLAASAAGRPALAAVVDYALARTLDAGHLTAFPAHRLSLLQNDSGDGTHSFRFFGSEAGGEAGTDAGSEAGGASGSGARGEPFKRDATLDDQELQDLITQARGALRLAAWGTDAPWSGEPYAYGGAPDPARLWRDLLRMAVRGYRFYDALVNRLAGDTAAADRLQQLMRRPGLVQLALRAGARHLVPLAMFYDRPLDTGLDPGAYRPCPEFEAALASARPLAATSCFAGACPTWGRQEVVCPSGFWGFRHPIGFPISQAQDAQPVIDAASPALSVAVSTDRRFVERAAHVTALRGLRPDLGWAYAEHRDRAIELLRANRGQVVYFFCHGGAQGGVPYLQVGAEDERGITRDNLRAAAVRWTAPRPLVFVNGCLTAALEPRQALELVSAFVDVAGAAGVIGTEITVFEPLARTFAEAFLTRLLAGTAVGEAVRLARLALLARANPLGLAYVPFAVPSLALARLPVLTERLAGMYPG